LHYYCSFAYDNHAPQGRKSVTSLHETAYPRFKPDLTPRELEEIYRPTDNEMRLARRLTKSGPARLYLLILLKATQRLGYFAMLADVPPPIITYLVKFIGMRSVAHRDLVNEENHSPGDVSSTRSVSI
jgi:hypothetical protein